MADDTVEMIAIIATSGFLIMAGATVKLNRRKRKKRCIWVKCWILVRPVRGEYNTLFNELMKCINLFKNYIRMDDMQKTIVIGQS